MDDLIGRVIGGKYRLVAFIAQGGMGSVFQAEQLNMPRQVAIKIADPYMAAQPAFVKRFHQEIGAIASLEHAQGILPVYDMGEEDELLYMVMPLVTGGSLKDKLIEGGSQPWSARATLPLAEQVLAALAYAHEHGLIHRDVKPSNILFERDRIYLADFGIAKVRQDSSEQGAMGATLTGAALMGTPTYMAPEQALGLPVDQRADIYGFGVVLYEVLTGRVPYQAKTPMQVAFKHVEAALPLPREVNPALAPQIEAVLLRALAREPEQRFPTALDFSGAFRHATDLAEPVQVTVPALATASVEAPATPAAGGTLTGFGADSGRGAATPPAGLVGSAPNGDGVSADDLVAFVGQSPSQEGLGEAESGPNTEQRQGQARWFETELFRRLERVKAALAVREQQIRGQATPTPNPAIREAREQAAREIAAREAKAKAEREQAAREQAAREQAAREQVAREQAAREQAAREQAAREQAAKEQAAREQAAREQAAKKQAAREQAAREQAAKEQAAREQAAREQAAREQAAREQAAREQAAREQAAREQAAREQAAREQAAREQAAREQAAREAKAKAEREQAAREQAARELAAKEQAAREQAAREQAAKEQAAREQAAREQAAREHAAKERAAREQAAREQAAREQAAREQAAREQAAREQAAREQAAREQAAKERAAREQAAKEAEARERAAAAAAAAASETQRPEPGLVPSGSTTKPEGTPPGPGPFSIPRIWIAAGAAVAALVIAVPIAISVLSNPPGPRPEPTAEPSYPSPVPPTAVPTASPNEPPLPLTRPRVGHTATLLGNGKILVAGGQEGDSVILATAEVYDPAANRWTSAGEMSRARYGHTATLLKDGQVLVAGGHTTSNGYLASSELYDPVANRWTSVEPLSSLRAGHSATLLKDGRVLVTGGMNESLYHATADVYDPATKRWNPAGRLDGVRTDHATEVLPSGQALILGGTGGDDAGTFLSSAEIYDPATNRWSDAPAMSVRRAGPVATLLKDGQVLVTGGYYPATRDGAIVPMLPVQAERFDPATKYWVAAGSLAQGRVAHTATLLPNGKVLVAGGQTISSGTAYLAATEVFDPATGAWSAGPSLAHARAGHTMTVLPNGQIVVVGGQDASGRLASVERYDPTDNRWISSR